MAKNEVKLLPSYWASVSGGKDSLYMLNLILNNLDKYPLNGVVHFELEIDYPFIKDVIDYMENQCKKYNIPFFRIKPEKTFEELYEKYKYPTRRCRWCNSVYKLNCKKQFNKMMKNQGYETYYYIGYCIDENKRYENRKLNELYPLVDENIEENYILEWAKEQEIYNNYYKINKRCGCMGCPMSTLIEWAYLYKYYPDWFWYFFEKIKETEEYLKEKGAKYYTIRGNNKYDADYLLNIINTKYLPKLEEIEKE